MFKLKGKAGEIAKLITLMTARQGKGNYTFSPMMASVDTKKKQITFKWVSVDHVSLVWGEAKKLDLSGKSGDYVFNAELVDWINNIFGADDVITMEHRESTIILKNKEYEAKYIPTDADAADSGNVKFSIKDNLPTIANNWKLVELNIKEITKGLSPSTLVYGGSAIRVVSLLCSPKKSQTQIGEIEAHDSGVKRNLDAKTKETFSVKLGQSLADVISPLEGPVKIYGIDTISPLWILKEEENLTVGYLVAPFIDEGEPEPAPEPTPEKDSKPEEEKDEEEIELE